MAEEKAERVAINVEKVQTSEIGLAWKQLAYSIPDKKAADGKRMILAPQDGQANPGSLLALMGPSGSGKTSLLNGLAGRLPITKGAEFSGQIEVNGLQIQSLPCSFADLSAYVEQEDVLYALSTVQETLDFAARLRLPRRMSAKERDERIDGALQHLGLVHVRHTNVGGSSFNGALRGLSGGERKRLSIAIELLHNPKVLFLDEPTTGLDSYQALNVMQKLRQIADEGHTVVVSIHQPRSSIFAMLTGVYVLAEGRPVYAGPSDTVVEYFDTLGYPLPPKFNPADFLIDLVSIDQRDPSEQERTEKQRNELQEAWSKRAADKVQENSKLLSMSAEDRVQSILAARVEEPAGQTCTMTPLFLLLKRGWREQMRDKLSIALKIFFNAFFTMVFGLVYFQLDYSQKSIQDRMGLLFFLTMNQAFGSVIGCAQVIPRQLVIVNRERSNRLYALVHFYLSSLIVMVPIELVPQLINNAIIFFMANLSGSFVTFFGVLFLENIVGISLGMALSSGFKNVQMASQLAPAVVILFLMFSGFLINEDSVPVYFIWLREASFIRYAFKAAAVNELEGTKFECGPADAVCTTSGDQVLTSLGFDEENLVVQSIAVLAGICVLFNFLAYGILIARRPKFLSLKAGGAAVASPAGEKAAAAAAAASPPAEAQGM
eukprot:TRINITY_DN6762_c0_g1_i1.p1 TRINITY_DN6762_c0_g1~~TRINITY_DN6762_c0_g1_i1.p1  ORF type:complete len:661 (+),score=197.53 TRINITY_DN6762_c0_g1_i1:113-2095(+)